LELINWLLKKEEVVWVGKVEGRWDLIITLRCEEIEELYALLENFNNKFGKNIKEKQLLLSYELIWFNEKYLFNDTKNYYSITLRQKDGRSDIDETDKKIISILEHNSRTQTIDIAKEVKLTAQAVAKRIKILLEKGVIAGFKLRNNLAALDKGYHHIFISLRDFSKIENIVSYYKMSKGCVFIMKYHGSYDLHLELVSDSQNDFRSIIKDFRERFGDYVSDYSQLTILEESKLA
jgi:Lrp/AsnC family transcriptional regulator for asnA, asnC and gidA